MAAKDEGRVLHRQKLNGYVLYVLCMLGLGSISYGYNASIIGTTLGLWITSSVYARDLTEYDRSTILYNIHET
jgi:hypothetical protein